jgi:hypothetical protein
VPHASHRISLFIVPRDPEHQLSDTHLALLRETLVQERVLDDKGAAAENSESLVEGGFSRFRFDRPPWPVVYGNRLGGYRAQCPHCGASLAKSMESGLRRWRSGQGRDLDCESCLRSTSLEALTFYPPAAPGRWALVFSRAESNELKSGALDRLEALCGAQLQTIVVRG